ncbi:MAG: hypothetical protein AABY15_05395 [Nanoarchaeota archaeon]
MNIRQIIREELEDIIHTDIHGKKSSPVDYTAVVIEGDEIAKFESQAIDRLKKIGTSIPEGWDLPDDYHMTITKGPLSLGQLMAGAIGSKVDLEVTSIGISDKAIAFGVRGLYSRNKFQHITFAFKDNPADSNEITDWIEIAPFSTFGFIREKEKADGFGRLRQIDENFKSGKFIISENQKPLPKQFDHLKWKLNNNQKYYLAELCDVNPDTIVESDIKKASKFLGIPEKNVKSIINTYNTYNPMAEAVQELSQDSPFLLGNKPVTVAGAGMNVHNSNRAPVRANRTTWPLQDTMTKLEKKTMDYAVKKNRMLDRAGKGSDKEKYYESVYTSLMMYLFCEINPKDINLNHNNQIQIDQEPILIEGETFSMENSTYRKVNDLLKSFNKIFKTNFKISEHIDLSETSHKCHRTFVDHFGIADDKLFWCKDRKSWVKPGQNGYEKLREEYIENQGQQMSMPEIPRVDHREMLQKYVNGDLISYNPNADWLL